MTARSWIELDLPDRDGNLHPCEIDLEVDGHFDEGDPGDYTTPETPGGWVPESFKVHAVKVWTEGDCFVWIPWRPRPKGLPDLDLAAVPEAAQEQVLANAEAAAVSSHWEYNNDRI